MVVILFFCLNRLFHLCFNYRISYLLRAYSFWIYLIGMIILNDTETLSYLSIMQIKCLYHFDFVSMFTQLGSIVIIGVWFILFICIYILYYYICGEKCLVFYTNVDCRKIGAAAMILQYILKPLLKGAIHSFLFDDPTSQLLSLSII